MGLKSYKEAVDLIENNKSKSFFVGQRSDELILKAEETLGLKFSKLYKSFLKTYGAGNFGAEEIYGVIDEDFENSSVPDAIWFTLTERNEVNLPENLLVIYDTSSDEILCLDFNKLNIENEPEIVSFVPGLDLNSQKYEKIGEDFGDFLLQRVKLELNMI